MSPEAPSPRPHRELLRLLTAGSVDDGKSTLIGRLLADSGQIYEDHLDALRRDSARHGAADGATDFALLTDGLKAEREQGITIDVAYRYFATPRRKFIIADCPGHTQYTRNMATGASTADLAVILVDARQGITEQTRRHAVIAALLGISHVVVCVNKMDLVAYDEATYTKIRADYTSFAARLETRDVHFIPVSALHGDNVVTHSDAMPWFSGEPLLATLESVHIAADRNLVDLRFPVQLVLHPNADFRGLAGSVASGIVRRGQHVIALPSGQEAIITRISTFDGDRDEAFPPQAVTLCLDRDLDIGRGELLAQPRNRPRVGRALEVMVIWMHETPLAEGRRLLVKHTTRWIEAKVAAVRHRIDLATIHRQEATALQENEIGRVALELHDAIAFDPYTRNRTTGALILVDPDDDTTLGAALILDRGLVKTSGEPLPPPRDPDMSSRPPRDTPVSPEERQIHLGQRPCTIWISGAPGVDVTTLARRLERRLIDAGRFVAVVGPPHPLEETPTDFATAARTLTAAGLIAIVAAASAPDDEPHAAKLMNREHLVIVDVERGEDLTTRLDHLTTLVLTRSRLTELS